MRKPITPYQEVITLVLMHAFHPEVVYECIGVEDEIALGEFLDQLPANQSYLDKFDLSKVNSVVCDINQDQSVALRTLRNFESLKANLNQLKKRDIK